MTPDQERIRDLEQILWATAHDLHYFHKAGKDFTKCSHEPCIVAAKAVVGEPVRRYISPADTTVKNLKRRNINGTIGTGDWDVFDVKDGELFPVPGVGVLITRDRDFRNAQAQAAWGFTHEKRALMEGVRVSDTARGTA